MQEYKEFKLNERGKQRYIVKPNFAERIKRHKEGANMKTTDSKGDTDGSAKDRYIS